MVRRERIWSGENGRASPSKYEQAGGSGNYDKGRRPP